MQYGTELRTEYPRAVYSYRPRDCPPQNAPPQRIRGCRFDVSILYDGANEAETAEDIALLAEG